MNTINKDIDFNHCKCYNLGMYYNIDICICYYTKRLTVLTSVVISCYMIFEFSDGAGIIMQGVNSR